ncbi:MAG: RbsD/FucU family protein [Sarcina sp.]
MLKGIPSNISPKLIKILMEMGHGDQIVIADGNFPSTSLARNLVRLDGHNVPEILDSILKFFPLDTYTQTPISLMSVVSGDNIIPTIWNSYENIIKIYFPEFSGFDFIDRFAFYEKAKNAYAIIATSEKALYANILLTKGVVK